MFWCLLWHRLRSCLWGAPGHPKSCPNRKKTEFLRYFFHGLLHLSQPTFCLARRIHSQSYCNYSRLGLYLPSLGKVNMVTQYPQIAWEIVWGCGDDPPQASSIRESILGTMIGLIEYQLVVGTRVYCNRTLRREAEMKTEYMHSLAFQSSLDQGPGPHTVVCLLGK